MNQLQPLSGPATADSRFGSADIILTQLELAKRLRCFKPKYEHQLLFIIYEFSILTWPTPVPKIIY